MDEQRKSGCGSFVRKAILLAILAVLAAKLVQRFYPGLLPLLKARMMSCCCGGGCCGCCGKVDSAPAAEPAADPQTAPETATAD